MTLSIASTEAGAQITFEQGDTLQVNGKVLAENISEVGVNESLIKQVVLNTFFPVGSIYMDATGGIDPNVQFGGTWVKIENRFLLASGSKAVGATGGEENVTLNINQMPSHSHSASSYGANTSRITGASSTQGTGYSNSIGIPASGGSGWMVSGEESRGAPDQMIAFTSGYESHSHGIAVNNNGGGGAHNNMPPYQVVTIWKRTA